MASVPQKTSQSWSVAQEIRCRRETIWQALSEAGAWKSMWGECDVQLRGGGRFVDRTNSVMPKSEGEFVQVIPYRRFDMYWYMGRDKVPIPEKLGPDNAVLLSMSIEETAPSVQEVTIRAEWREDTYPPRGKWVALARMMWSAFLKHLADASKKLTRL